MWLWGIEGRECGAVRSLCGSATGNGAVWRERGACRECERGESFVPTVCGAGRCESVARERGRGEKDGRCGERGERGGAVGWRARAIKSRLFVRADGFGVGGEAGFGMSAGRVCNGRVFLFGVRRPVDLRRTGTCVPAGSVFR